MLLPPGPITTLIAPPQEQGTGTGKASVGNLLASGQLAVLAGTDLTVTTASGPVQLQFAPSIRFQPLDQNAAKTGLKTGIRGRIWAGTQAGSGIAVCDPALQSHIGASGIETVGKHRQHH